MASYINPFDKYFGKEDILQRQVTAYLRSQYPDIFWMHPVNEGRRTKFEQYKAKSFGMRSGMPDVIIFSNTLEYNGLAIELKIKPNKTTENQEACLKAMSLAGWCVRVCWSFEEAKSIIDNYFKN